MYIIGNCQQSAERFSTGISDKVRTARTGTELSLENLFFFHFHLFFLTTDHKSIGLLYLLYSLSCGFVSFMYSAQTSWFRLWMSVGHCLL